MKKEYGTMKQIINPKLFSTFIFFLSIILIVKVIWLSISLMFLPTVGEKYEQGNKLKALYYRVKLTNDAEIIAPVTRKKPRKIVQASMKGMKLLALYNSKETLVVTVEKNKKTTVLARGESIENFTLISAGANYAIFKKAEKEFTLNLNTKQIIGGHSKRQHKAPLREQKAPSRKQEIIEQDGVKIIDRSLLTNYISSPDKIWNDIGITENKIGGKLNGFKINYVKKGSDFQKLGLKRGDLLMAINAEKLDTISGVMDLYKNINNIENLTLTVERNGKSEDIEYEIK